MQITVYCGAHLGKQKIYEEAAKELGQWMARQGHSLVYGGGSQGLMGVLAQAVLEGGGQALGVIPESLVGLEIPLPGLTRLYLVQTMSERKKMMMDLGQAFVALPGGLGTLEEIMEVLSWKKIDHCHQPAFLYNVQGYYDPLKDFFSQMVQEGFLSPRAYDQVLWLDSLSDLEAHLIG